MFGAPLKSITFRFGEFENKFKYALVTLAVDSNTIFVTFANPEKQSFPKVIALFFGNIKPASVVPVVPVGSTVNTCGNPELRNAPLFSASVLLVMFDKSSFVKLFALWKQLAPIPLIELGSFTSVKLTHDANKLFGKPPEKAVLLQSIVFTPVPWKHPAPRLTFALSAKVMLSIALESWNDVFPIERKLAQFVKSSFVSFELRNESLPIVCKAEFSGKTSSVMFDP